MEIPNNNTRYQVHISEIKKLCKRKREINDNDINNIDFLDDKGFPVEIDQKFIDDWKYTGLNITDFIDSGFYLEGFTDEINKI